MIDISDVIEASIGTLNQKRVTALEALVDGPEFHKMKIEITTEFSYVDFDHLAIENSMVVSVGRLMAHKDDDFTVSVVGGKTRLTFTGDFASGGLEAIEAGDVVFATYAVDV